ncbi:MAG TPA: hypothetical protein VGM37_21865 [Armatimonadota bacterium]|jgi:Tol biopolymer transport system component
MVQLPAWAAAPTTVQASLAWDGRQPARSKAVVGTLSADGRFLAFESDASNLVDGDANNARDIFVRDLVTGTIRLESVGPDAMPMTDMSESPEISADGNHLVFQSWVGGRCSIFWRDLETQTTRLVSVGKGGSTADGSSYVARVSPDGRFVAFYSRATNLVDGDTNGRADVFLRDMSAGTTVRVSVASNGDQGDGDSLWAVPSADGLRVAFESNASNLVPNDANGAKDVFVRDLRSLTTSRVSVSSASTEGNASSSAPSMTPDGRYVAFESWASNLVGSDSNEVSDIFVRDTQTNVTTRESVTTAGSEADGCCEAPSISAGGRYVAFDSFAANLTSGSTLNVDQIYLRDRGAMATTLVSVNGADNAANAGANAPRLAAGGAKIAYQSLANNLTTDDSNGAYDVFVWDLGSHTAVRGSAAPGGKETGGDAYSRHPAVSADGNIVAFVSDASNLVSDDLNDSPDVFVRDITLGTIQRVNVGGDCWEESRHTDDPPFGLSADGRFVAFVTSQPMIAEDMNCKADVYLRDLKTGAVERASLGAGGAELNGDCYSVRLSADGTWVAFSSAAANVVPGDANNACDVFRRNRVTGAVQCVSVNTQGAPASGYSSVDDVSSDGRYVLFRSQAPGLAATPTPANGARFVRDMTNGTTELVPGSNFSWYARLDADGRAVAFSAGDRLDPADPDSLDDVYLFDRVAKVTKYLSKGRGSDENNPWSVCGGISANGRYVAFGSGASGLVPGDTNKAWDAFVADTATGGLSRVSVATDGSQASCSQFDCDISADGRYAVFGSSADGLATGAVRQIFVRGPLRDAVPGYLRFATEPTAARLGHAVQPGPAVEVCQADGLVDTGYSGPVAVSLVPGTGTAGAALVGSSVVWATAGVARFSNVVVDRPGVGYVLMASQGGMEAAQSLPFTVVGDPARLSWSVQPGRAFVSRSISPPPTLVAVDALGSLVEDDARTVSLSLVSDSGAALSGSASAEAVGGRATFASVSVNRSGRRYALRAATPGLPSVDSDLFDVMPSVPIERVSVSTGGGQAAGSGVGSEMSMSPNARYVVFTSSARGLDPQNRNSLSGVFWRDRATSKTELLSVGLGGDVPNDVSFSPSVSADGRMVGFGSYASNLVQGDSNGMSDIYVADRVSGSMRLVSIGAAGEPANNDSFSTMMSADGRYLAFGSYASNLVPNDTNASGIFTGYDVFVRDLGASTTLRASVSTSGVQADANCDPVAISADGRFVLFDSGATNLVTGDTNHAQDVFLRDCVGTTTERVSVGCGGVQADASCSAGGGSISPDGRFVAFESSADNLVAGDTNGLSDIFLRDRALGVTERISVAADGAQANGPSSGGSVSTDGRYVLFASRASNLTPDANSVEDIFLRDRLLCSTVRVSISADGEEGAGISDRALLTPDGKYAIFRSSAANLVSNDTNGVADAFVAGPLLPVYTVTDIIRALRLSGGMVTASRAEVDWLSVVTGGASTGRVDLLDAVRIARKVAGLDANP